MSRPTRSFKLRLSPAGMDLLIDCHCHLIRATRCLIPWGTTLHVAVVHLSTVTVSEILAGTDPQTVEGLYGEEEHHVGAPHQLVEIASTIAGRIGKTARDKTTPSLGAVYLLALQHLLAADPAILLARYNGMKMATLGRPSN